MSVNEILPIRELKIFRGRHYITDSATLIFIGVHDIPVRRQVFKN